MSIKLHRVQRTNVPSITTLLVNGKNIEVRGSLDNMRGCGWFVTKTVTEVVKVNNFCTLMTEDIFLRQDNVKVKCVLNDENTFECKYCIDKKV